jgi:integrase
MAKVYRIPDGLGFRYRIQTPAGKHKGFRLFKVFSAPKPGESKSVQVNIPELDNVNAKFKIGQLSRDEAKRLVDGVVEDLYRNFDIRKVTDTNTKPNQATFESFWKKRYGDRSVKLVDEDSTIAKYDRALASIGDLNLITAPLKELQVAVDRYHTDHPNRHREACLYLNAILTVEREEFKKDENKRLIPMPEEAPRVKYLTPEELERVLAFVDLGSEKETYAFQVMSRVAFGTGARIGELFALTDFSYRGGRSIHIRNQIRRSGVEASLKSKRSNDPGRPAYVLQDFRKWIKVWLEVRNDLDPKHRTSAANIIKAAARKAFGGRRPDKEIKFHDLRHSYAIELCRLEVSIQHIAQNLGNSEAVCSKHYIGFTMTTEVADLIEAKEEAAKKRKKGS